jgi:hypothetical protein
MIPVQEVVNGLTVDAIASLTRQAVTAFTPITGRRKRADLDAASSFNSYELIDRAFPELVSGVDEAALIDHLRSNQVQSLIQELLAIRLSDGPELTVQRLKEEFTRVCCTPYADEIFEEIDAQAANLAIHIGTANPELLRQIREEAHFTRLNATVEAIERHLAAQQAPHDDNSDLEYFESYQRHVSEHHGVIEPPDFGRRRRVPIADLYVEPNIMETLRSGGETRKR